MPTCTGPLIQTGAGNHPVTPHAQTTMVFVKSWPLQGNNQKQALIVELWKCPTCGRTLKKGRKEKDKSDLPGMIL